MLAVYSTRSAYTGFTPAFAGEFQEQDDGQNHEKQQGSEEAVASQPERKENGQTGQEARIGYRAYGSPLNFSALSDDCCAGCLSGSGVCISAKT
jgi:hypothetical protein